MEPDFEIHTRFTKSQLERLSELVTAAHYREPTPASHNLLRKLTEYCATVNHMQRLRRTA